jgi:hypothetical protein
MAKADFLTGLTLVLFSLYVIIESWLMPRMEHLSAHPLSAPGLVPGVLGIVIFLLGSILLIRSILRGGHRLGLRGEIIRQALAQSGNRRLLLAIALTMGYAGLAVGTLPFALATVIFIFIFILLFEWEKNMTNRRFLAKITAPALIAFFTAAAVTLVFERLFFVVLP